MNSRHILHTLLFLIRPAVNAAQEALEAGDVGVDLFQGEPLDGR